jgi:hypothetical protein
VTPRASGSRHNLTHAVKKPLKTLAAHLSNFTIYWRRAIRLTEWGVDEIGTLATPNHRLSFAWGDITCWERKQLSSRGKPKLHGRLHDGLMIVCQVGPTASDNIR